MDKFEYSLEISIRCALFVFQIFTAFMKPRIRKIYEDEWWLYKNPRADSYVPSYIIIIVAFANIFIFPLAMLIINRKKLSVCFSALMGYSLATLLSISITNLLKLLVGRPRPDFFYRCFIDGERLLSCNGDEDDIMEGLKSFPSGHSSLSMVSFGFVSLFLLGQLRVFADKRLDSKLADRYVNQNVFFDDGRFLGCKFLLSVTPLVAALLICISRLIDFHHHFEDISVGAGIGLVFAYLCYRLYFPSIFHHNCNIAKYDFKSKRIAKLHLKIRNDFCV